MPSKITALDAIAAVADADVIAIVDDVAGTPKTCKATITQLKAQVLASPTITGNASVAGTSTLTGKVTTGGEIEIDGALNHDGSTVGFFGVTPATRASAYTQTYSTAVRTVPTPPAAITGGEDPTEAEFNALNAHVIELTKLVNALIDDLQSYGLAQ